VTSIRCNGIEALAHYFVNQAVFHGRYDAIEEFNLDSKAECGQLNLAHVARNKKYKKEETKTNMSVPLSPVKAKNGEDGLEGSRKTMEERICDTEQLSLAFQAEGVIDAESEGDMHRLS